MLVKDGGAAAAVPILEDVLRQLRLHLKDVSNVRFAQAYLGDAYDQVGRTAEALALLQAARSSDAPAIPRLARALVIVAKSR